MIEITTRIICCEGKEAYPGQCKTNSCPMYKNAASQVNRAWPYVGTGFGNLYGNPSKEDFLRRVQNNLSSIKGKDIDSKKTEEIPMETVLMPEAEESVMIKNPVLRPEEV